MADQKVSELASITTVGLNSLLYVVQGGESKRTTVGNFVSSIAANIWVTTPPATSTSTGVRGTMAYDTSNVYVCVATNTWKKIALSDW
jgi:hypothetical protein